MLFNFKFKEEVSYKKVWVTALLVLAGIIVGVGGTFLYIQKFGIPFKGMSQNLSKLEQDKILAETMEKVGKLIVLPKDETPVVATIADAATLIQKEPFYAGSKNGDIVLMYQKALKAIIYSPDRNIIVNVGPVYVPPQDQTSADQGQQNQQGQNALTEVKSTSTASVLSASSTKTVQKKK